MVILLDMIKARLTEPDQNEILAYLRAKADRIDEQEMKRIAECTGLVKEYAAPALVYKRVKCVNGNIEDLPLEGDSIRRLLNGAKEAVVFAATLGPGVDRLISRFQVTDMAKAVIIDAAASAAIENVCNNFEAEMRGQVEGGGMTLTYRFSPGYGDLPISTQSRLAEFLNCQRMIGLSVSEKYLMTPVKSVTAIMGIIER